MSVDMSVDDVDFDTPKTTRLVVHRFSLGDLTKTQLIYWAVLRVIHSSGRNAAAAPWVLPYSPLNGPKTGDIYRGHKFDPVRGFIRNQIMKLNTIDDVAQTLAVSRSTIIRLVRSKQLAVTRIGRAVRISDESLRHFIDSQTSHTLKGQAEE